MNKKFLTIVLLSVICLSPVKTFAACEQPGTFDSKFQELSQKEGDLFKSLSTNFSTALGNFIAAINKETISILEAVNIFRAEQASNMHAMNGVRVVLNRQAANAENKINNRSIDYDDIACAKVNLSEEWNESRAASQKIANVYVNTYMTENNDKTKDANMYAKIIADNNTEKYSETLKDGTVNPLVDADINAGSLFGLNTFKNIVSKNNSKGIVTDSFEAALDFSKNIVGSMGGKVRELDKQTEAGDPDLLRDYQRVSQKNLAYAVFSKIMGAKTLFKGTGAGKKLRANYAKLGINGTGAATEAASSIQDDISEYEFKDHMYSKMLLNPDWLISLDRNPKQLKIEKLDVINRTMALEWDTLLALEMLATVDSANLANTVNKN